MSFRSVARNLLFVGGEIQQVLRDNALRNDKRDSGNAAAVPFILKEVRNLPLSREWKFHIYIVASKSRVVYVGMTNDLFDRVMQHKKGEIEGFTKKYKINRLVYFEKFRYVNNCIAREKQLKGFSRIKKVALIESMNPTWADFAADWGTKIKSLPIDPSKPD